jgi:hypothetical protein
MVTDVGWSVSRKFSKSFCRISSRYKTSTHAIFPPITSRTSIRSFGVSSTIAVARTVGSAWFGLYVEGCAEVVAAAASRQNGQLGHLGCKFGFALFYEQLLKLHGQLRNV